MAEYIEREESLMYCADYLKQLVDELVSLNDDNLAQRVIDNSDVQWCLSEMQDILAVDVAPVWHGRWIHEETEGGFHIWRCSRCGRGMNNNPEGIDLYCYHCGARIDGGTNNEKL